MFDFILVDATNRVRTLYYLDKERTSDTFIKSLQALYKRTGGAIPICLWDHPEAKLVRRMVLPEYKKNRNENDKDEIKVLEASRNYIESEGVTCWDHPEFEADDLIATLIRYDKWMNKSILIWSNDKDMFQHLSSRVMILRTGPMDPNFSYTTQETVFQKYGVLPQQWQEFCALKGDSSDGIPGVARIGDKTAMQILHTASTVKNAMTCLDDIDISAKRKASLVDAVTSGLFEKMLWLVKPQICPVIPQRILDAERIWKESHPQEAIESSTSVTETHNMFVGSDDE